jgi:hypothetical protein
MKSRIQWLIATWILATPVFAAPPPADTQGRIQAVMANLNFNAGYDSFLVYIADVDQDRWGCIA